MANVKDIICNGVARIIGNLFVNGKITTNGVEVATKNDVSTLQSNFQAGVDGIYDTIVAQGTTPASKSLSDVKTGINSLSTNRYNNGYSAGNTAGYNSGKTDYNPTDATLSNAGELNVTNASGTSRLTKTFTNNYNSGYGNATTEYNPKSATLSNTGVLSVKNNAGTEKYTTTFTNNYNAGVAQGESNIKNGTQTKLTQGSWSNNKLTVTASAGYNASALTTDVDASSIYTNGYNSGVSATKVGTAVAGDVLEGKTFTNSSGVGISGTIKVTEKLSVPAVPPLSHENTTNPPSWEIGEYVKTLTVYQAWDSNLIPENIVNGKTIFNVTGTATQLINNVIGRGLLYGGSANYTPSAMLDVREFNYINIHLAATNTSPTFYLHGVTEFPNASSIKSTTSSVTVPNQDSHEPITWKATSSSELETDITVNISDYDYIVMTKNYNGGTQSIAYYYEMNK